MRYLEALLGPASKYFRILYMYSGRKFILVLFLSALSSFSEGIGLLILLPLLNLIIGSASSEQIESSGYVREFVHFLETHFSIEYIGLLAIIAFGLKGAFTFGVASLSAKMRGDLLFNMRSAALISLSNTNFENYLRTGFGKLSNLFGEQIARSVHAFKSLVSSFVQLVACIIYISFSLILAPGLGLVAAFLGLLLWFTFSSLTDSIKNDSRALARNNSDLSGNIIQLVHSFRYLKSTQQTKSVTKSILKNARILSENQTSIGIRQAVFTGTREPILVTFLLVTVYLNVALWDQEAQTLLVSALLFYRGLSAILAFQTGWMVSMEMAGSLEFVEDEIKALNQASYELEPQPYAPTGPVGFKTVDATYVPPGGDNGIITNINVTIPPKTTTAIVGPSGSGKSTFLDLLIGLRRPTSGKALRILDDGTAIEIFTPSLAVGYLPQEPMIIKDTVFNNILMNLDYCRAASNHEKYEFVCEICEKVGLLDQIKSLPNSFDTMLNENGSNLSGGQRQRLALARELARGASTLILDEPTSALDQASTEIVISTLKALAKDTTIIMVSHDEESIGWVDNILRFQNGNLVNDVAK